MGSELSRSIRAWRARKLRRVLLVGLDNSGKTTMLRQIGGEEDPQGTVPTTEAAYTEASYKGMTLLLTDVGGQAYLRPYWRHHFTGAQGVVYVVDSMDSDRFVDAKEELRVLLVDSQLKNVPVVIFANKQDGPGAVGPDQIQELVIPKGQQHDRELRVFGGSALSGEGIWEALDYLSANMVRV